MHFITPIKSEVKRAATLLLSLLMLSACSHTEDLPQPEPAPQPETGKTAIRWEIQSVDGMQNGQKEARALTESYTDLRDACTANEIREAEKIGLFGKYTLSQADTVVFNNRDLWWWDKPDGNPFKDYLGNDNHWNYDGEDEYWTDNATYTFRAYYPKSEVTLQPGSDTDQLLIVYNTQATQYDLLVAYKQLLAKSENPVQLIFKHALAALKFNFLFTESGVTDQLTACWLENSRENGFYTSSTLNHGTGDALTWPVSTSNPVGEPMYYWSPATPINISSNQAATAYTTDATADNGELYTQNDGWLLVVPQACAGPESLKLCFKTTTGGDAVYRAGIPAVTYQAGYRYTYNIKITPTKINVTLTIAAWNERNSSYDIDFNN